MEQFLIAFFFFFGWAAAFALGNEAGVNDERHRRRTFEAQHRSGPPHD